MEKRIRPIKNFNMMLSVPPDKSITHRAFMLGAVADGVTTVYNPLYSDDCLSTLDCLKKAGVSIENTGGKIVIKGRPDLKGADMYAGNSGTTVRLMSGLLAPYSGECFNFTGDASLSKRPMERVSRPLELMGARITLSGGRLPMKIQGAKLNGITYKMPVASAQVKSAILLAGINADGVTTVEEDIPSRNHTELMLKGFNADIETKVGAASVRRSKLRATDVYVPGDISSAAFPLILAAAKKGAHVVLKNTGINETRMGVVNVLRRMGANIRIFNERTSSMEKCADIELEYTELKPFEITGADVPSLIDEIPALAVLACFTKGRSEISGAEELAVKESNRILTVADSLKKMGANVTAKKDGLIIEGNGSLKGGAVIETKGDHRIAMSMALAAALSDGGGTILDAECASVSYPGFYDILDGR